MRRALIGLLVTTAALAARADATTETGAFAVRSGSAVGAVLGEGIAALGGSAEAALWNPASVINVGRPHLVASYHDLFGLGLARYGDVAFAWRPVREDAVTSDGDIVVETTTEGPVFIFSASALSVDLGDERYTEVSPGVGAAVPLASGGSIGALARFLRTSATVSGVSATGYTLDVGIFQPLGSSVTASLALRNLLGRLSWKEGDEETMPSEWAGAVAVRPHERVELVAGAAADLTGDLVDRAHGGARVGAWVDHWWLLVGVESRRSGDETDSRATFGTEFATERVRAAYAFLPEADTPGNTHRISLGVSF